MSLVSLVVPVFNEEKALPAFYEALKQMISDLNHSFEVIFVDDGSKDGTWNALEQLQTQDSTVKLLGLSRNFGHQAALLAGIENATGDCVITMDGDLEHPPHVIPQLITEWQNGAEVVNTRRRNESQLPLLKRVTSAMFYKVFRFLSGLELEPGMADFRLLDRCVVEALQRLHERALFLRGMLQWVGFRQVVIDYTIGSRSAGESKYSFKMMFQLALDGITAFSAIPLRLATLLGFAFSSISFAYLAYAGYSLLFTDYTAEPWKAVIGSLLFLGGVQLICIGIIGEYMARVFQEVKGRPVYIVKVNKGFDNG